MRNKKGFTLIELLAVIVIIAIIATIGVYTITKIINTARFKSLKDTAINVKRATLTYLTQQETLPTGTFEIDMTPEGEATGDYAYLLELGNDPYGNPYEKVFAEVTPLPDSKYKIVVYVYLENGSKYYLSDLDGELYPINTADILVIGGGGGGAEAGSGGGAGGYVYRENVKITPGTYNVTVGQGGLGGTIVTWTGQNGFDSQFLDLIAFGGGGGVSHGNQTGNNGGSGGGGAITGGGSDIPTPGIGLQGHDGGSGHIYEGYYGNNGGGGGAGTPGSAGCYESPGCGDGGNGLYNNITGENIAYAGGGGGGELNDWSTPAVGGIGGGGNTTNDGPGTNGVNGLGGGGGGGSYNWNGTYYTGGNGGSGVVIIRFKKGSFNLSGGITTYTADNYEIHTFLNTQSITISN